MTSEFDDEVLVAYLDGELDTEQTQKIDQQIASHADLRERINQLRMTWDMLDELPVAPPSPRFAETTLVMAALSATEDPKSPSKSLSNWLLNNVSRIFIFSLPLLFLSGFFVFIINQKRAERQLLRDLPILVDWRALSNIDSQDWLEVLVDQPDLVPALKGPELGLVGDGEVPIQLNERRDWVMKLDDAERRRLSNNLAEFRQRDPSRQLELRKIIGKIYSDLSTKEKYLSAARCYELLLQKQSMTQRSALYDLPIEERKGELFHLISGHRSQLFAKAIPASDATAIIEWAERMRDMHLILHNNKDALHAVEMDLYDPACEISFQDFENLAEHMSPEAKSILQGLNSTDTYVNTLIFWVQALAVPNEASGDRIGAEKLSEIYMNLSGLQQDRVDLLPPEQARASLQKLGKLRAVRQPNES